MKKPSGPPKLRPLTLPPRTVSKLSNGLEVTIVPRGPLPLVAVRFLARGGSAYDGPNRHGLAELTSRLLRRGAGGMTAEAIDEQVDYVAAMMSAWATEDSFEAGLNCNVAHFDDVLEVFAKVLQKPDFAEDELGVCRRRMLAQVANALDDPEDLADRALVAALYADHPYGHESIGRKAHLEAITRADVVEFHRARVAPDGGALFIVGNVEPKATLAAVEKAFGSWQGSTQPLPPLPEWQGPARLNEVVMVHKPEQTQAQVRIGARGVYRGHPDHFPLVTMNTVLGGGFTSRLNQQIRVKRNLSYSAGSQFDQLVGAGEFIVSSSTKNESLSELIDVSLSEVKKMREKGPTAAEARGAQQYVSGLYPARLETNESVAAALADIALHRLPADWVDQYRERVVAVSRDAAAEAAARHLPGEHVMVVVGDAEQIEQQVRAYGKLSTVSISELE